MTDRKRAVITGGSSGIGAALARDLADKGLDVLVTGRDEYALADTCSGREARMASVAADLADPGMAQRIASTAGNKPIDFVVHAAGAVEPVAPLASVSAEGWQANFAVQVHAAVYLIQALLDRLHGGRILLVSSGAAHRPVAHWGAYCCAKAAQRMLRDCLNLELNRHHILATTARPGVVDTPAQARLRACDRRRFPDVHHFRKLHEEGRLHAPGTVATFLAWLLLECGDGAFADREWDIDDPDHQPLWMNTT